MNTQNTIDPEKIALCEAVMKELMDEIQEKNPNINASFSGFRNPDGRHEFTSSSFKIGWYPTLAQALKFPNEEKIAKTREIEREADKLRKQAGLLEQQAKKLWNEA